MYEEENPIPIQCWVIGLLLLESNLNCFDYPLPRDCDYVLDFPATVKRTYGNLSDRLSKGIDTILPDIRKNSRQKIKNRARQIGAGLDVLSMCRTEEQAQNILAKYGIRGADIKCFREEIKNERIRWYEFREIFRLK